MSTDVETVVIGAGVVGLATARALVAAGHDVLVLERHGGIGQETSGRSSEVIHAGLYYPPGSLKARFCVEGRNLLYAFARENGIPHVRYGKLLVATREEDVPRLGKLAETARANGVVDIARLSAEEVRQREPDLSAVAALYSPSTGVVDSHALMVALEGHVRAGSGCVVLETRVTALGVGRDGAFEIATESGTQGERAVLKSRNLVIAAGLGATALGATLGGQEGYAPPQTYPARGHYYALEGAAPFRHLVYPMPGEAWLGIHLTLDVTGRAKFGPDLEWQSEPSCVFDDAEGARRALFAKEIRRYWPALQEERLVPAYVGVRPKIYAEGEPAADFTIHTGREHGWPRCVALYGIESPGLTSALAIGDFVAEQLNA